jgi:hypothetical protein
MRIHGTLYVEQHPYVIRPLTIDKPNVTTVKLKPVVDDTGTRKMLLILYIFLRNYCIFVAPSP